ncbi:MAG: hypothetical protein ACI4TI_02275 [Christensenellales bacterium]
MDKNKCYGDCDTCPYGVNCLTDDEEQDCDCDEENCDEENCDKH